MLPPPPESETLLLELVDNEVEEVDSFVLWDDFESGTTEEGSTGGAPVDDVEEDEPAKLSMGTVPIPEEPSHPGISRYSLPI